MAPKVFFIGLGNMGWFMAKNILEKAEINRPLTVYNRTAERATVFAAEVPAGTVAVASSIPEAAAAADVVFTMLSDDAAVEAVYAQVLSEAAGPATGKLFIDSSTIHPDTSTRLAAQAEAAGAAFVAAPVFGAPAMAAAGQLIGVLAGTGAAVDRARVFFPGVTARAEILMRDEPVGRAPLLKLLGNTFIMNMVEQVAEGHVLADKAGLASEHLHRWIELMFPGGPYAAYSQRMLSGQYYTRPRPLFAVDLARKDLGHALALADQAGAALPNAATADAHLAQVQAHDGARGDVAAIYGVLREAAGLPYGNQETDSSQ